MRTQRSRNVRTVAIVDRFALARIGVERVLSTDPDVEVVASVEDIEALEHCQRDIDVIIVGLPSAEAASRFPERSEHDGRRRGAVLAICAQDSPPDPLLAVLRRGVSGLVSRTTGLEEFLLAVDAVARGGRYVAADVMAMVGTGWRPEQAARATSKPTLAPRELETVSWLVNGLTHRQVAHRMGLTEATVNTYVKRLRAKLNVGNKAELTRKVIELGYLSAGAGG